MTIALSNLARPHIVILVTVTCNDHTLVSIASIFCIRKVCIFQVLQHTRLIVGRYAGGKAVVAIEAHATFKTAQAAHPDDPELAKVIKNRKPSTAGTKRQSLSAAISAAYKARKSGEAPRHVARRRSSEAAPNGARVGSQNGAANGARAAAGHSNLSPPQMSGGGAVDAPYGMLDAHMPGAGRSPMHSHRSRSSGGTDAWQSRNSTGMQQMGLHQMARQHSNQDGRISESATLDPLDPYRSGDLLGQNTMQSASPRNANAFPTPVYSDALPGFGSGMPAQDSAKYPAYFTEGASGWELNALAQMTTSHGAGVQLSLIHI